MLRAVADTHAVIWYIFGDARLSTTATDAIAQIASAGDQVAFCYSLAFGSASD